VLERIFFSSSKKQLPYSEKNAGRDYRHGQHFY